MSATADPRILDKKKKDDDTPEKTYVTYREPIIVDGVQDFKIHGPIPSEEWAAYEKEHGL